MLERPRRVVLLIDYDNLQICAARDTPGRDLQLPPVMQLAQRYGSLEEKNRHLQAAYSGKIKEFLEHPAYDTSTPTILSAHIHVVSALVPSLFRISEQESIVFSGMICAAQSTPETPTPLFVEAAMMPETLVPWPSVSM